MYEKDRKKRTRNKKKKKTERKKGRKEGTKKYKYKHTLKSVQRNEPTCTNRRKTKTTHSTVDRKIKIETKVNSILQLLQNDITPLTRYAVDIKRYPTLRSNLCAIPCQHESDILSQSFPNGDATAAIPCQRV